MRAGGAFLLWRQAGHRWNGSAASTAKPVLRILCIGESTTGPKEENDWPHQLYEILSARRTDLDVQVINEGVGCTNSARIVAAVPDWVRLFHPHIVIAMRGINDVEWYGFSEPQNSSPPFVKLSRLRLWKLAPINNPKSRLLPRLLRATIPKTTNHELRQGHGR